MIALLNSFMTLKSYVLLVAHSQSNYVQHDEVRLVEFAIRTLHTLVSTAGAPCCACVAAPQKSLNFRFQVVLSIYLDLFNPGQFKKTMKDLSIQVYLS